MIVGVVRWELHLADCSSLKDKRRILKSLKDRLRNKFNVSVSEVDLQDTWQRGVLACCTVAPDRVFAEKVLTQADNLVADHPLTRIIDSQRSFR